jgi:hypothetical protein
LRLEEVFNGVSLNEALNDFIVGANPVKDVGLRLALGFMFVGGQVIFPGNLRKLVGSSSLWRLSGNPPAHLWKINGTPLAMDRGQLLLPNMANMTAKPQRQNG